MYICVYIHIYIYAPYIHIYICTIIHIYIYIIAYSKSTERMNDHPQNLLTSRQVEATNSAPSKGVATSSQGKGSCASCLRETCRELIFKGTGSVRTSFCGWLLQKSGKLTHQLRLEVCKHHPSIYDGVGIHPRWWIIPDIWLLRFPVGIYTFGSTPWQLPHPHLATGG